MISEALPKSSQLRIGLVETDPMRVVGVRCALEQADDARVVITSLGQLIADDSIGLGLLGLFQEQNPTKLIRQIRAVRPRLDLLVMSDRDENRQSAISAGAKGFLNGAASPAELLQAVRAIRRGETWTTQSVNADTVRTSYSAVDGKSIGFRRFTQRELQVLKLLNTARSNREIAQELGLGERTIKTHIARLMRKAGVETRTALSIHVIRESLTDEPQPE